MAYVFPKPGSPFWWMGFLDETQTQAQESSKVPMGTKPREKKESEATAYAMALARERECADRRAGKQPDLITGCTFEALAEKYTTEHAAALRSAGSTASRMKHLVAHFGAKLVTSISTGDVRAFLTKMQTKATPAVEGISRSGVVLKKSSVEHLRCQLRTMFNFAMENHLVRENPVKKELEVQADPVEVRFLEMEQAALVIIHAPDRWRSFIATALYLGLRKGEVIGLRCKSVDLARGVVTVSHSYDGPTKSGRNRVVPIPAELVPFLKAELGRQRCQYLFPSAAGKMLGEYTKTEKIIRRAAVAAGLVEGFDHICRRKGCGFVERRADNAPSRCQQVPPGKVFCGFQLYVRPVPIDIQFKDTRSTWATHAYEATGDETFVQDSLGHQDIATTGLYNAKRLAHAVKQGAKISYNLLAVAGTRQEEVAQVVRIDASDRGVTECAILDSNQWPLAPEPKGGALHGVSLAPPGLPVRALGSPRRAPKVAPATPSSPQVSGNRLPKTAPLASRLSRLAARFP